MKTFILFGLSFCLTMTAQATHIGEDTLSADISTATQQLEIELKKHDAAAADRRLQHYDRMMKLAAARQSRMVHRLDTNPKAVLDSAMPDAVRAKFPEKIRALIEERVSLSGALSSMIADDFQKKISKQSFYLKTTNGQSLEIRLSDSELLANGLSRKLNRQVSAKGLKVGRKDLVISSDKDVTLAADGTGTNTGTVAAVTAVVQGDQKTLVIMGNFSDKPIACTQPDLQQRLLGTVGATMNVGYQQSSGGRVSFSGDVIGPFNIDSTSTSNCDTQTWSTALDSAALAAGYNISNYKRVSYALPPHSVCGWSGIATLGGSVFPTRSWVMTCASTGVFTHELGHNLLFHHAATPTFEYGDGSDPMGGAKVVQSNAPNRVMAGWYTDAQLVDVTASGSFAINALENNSATSPLILRIPKPDSNEYYYLSLRQGIDIDTGLVTTYLNKLAVHRSAGTLPAKTFLLANLLAGESFNDPTNGISIKLESLVGSVANVSVVFGPPTCVRRNPIVSVTPGVQSAPAGTALTYNLSITNTDDPGCPAASFSVNVHTVRLTGPISAASWNILSGGTGAIAPGATGIATATLTPSATTLPGDIRLDFTVTNVASSAFLAKASAIYTITGCARANPTLAISPSNQSGAPGASLAYNLTLTNNDSSDCGASIFNVNLPIASGWSGGISNSPVTISPKSNSVIPFSITSPLTAQGMAQVFTATATNTVLNSSQGSASGTYTVVVAPPSDTTSPSAPTLSGRYIARKNQASLSWTTATDNVAVTKYRLYRDGVLVSEQTSLSYVDAAIGVGGTYRYQVRALDAAGNEGLSNILSISAMKSTGKPR